MSDKMRGVLEMLNAEEPEYHSRGMGCGLEDRNIIDRYEAMNYGWDGAMERVYDEVIVPARELLEEALTQQPAQVPKETQAALGMAKDLLTAHNIRAPRVLGAINRALAAPSIAQVPEGWRETIETAIERAMVFDDGSDGADAESAQSVVALLTGLLTAAPSIAEKREWIRCVDRLPTAEDADSDDAVWWACFYPEDKDPWLLAREPWTTPDDAAYWMPTGLQRPEPPGPKP